MGRILLVEDDDSIRFMIAQMLSHYGHETVEAENGLVALNVLTRDTAFDAVITDLRMAVIDGIRLTTIIKADYPWLPVIATVSMKVCWLRQKTEGPITAFKNPSPARNC